MKFYSVCAIFFFGSYVSAKCPTNVQTVTSFNAAQWGGIWYLSRRTATSLYDREKCVMQIYYENSNTLNRLTDVYIDNQTSGVGRHRNVTLEMPKGNTVGYFTATYPSDGTFTMHVVYSDQEAVSAIVACAGSFLNIRRHALILSRFEQPTEQQLLPAYQKLAENGFNKNDFVLGFSPNECADPFTVAPPIP